MIFKPKYDSFFTTFIAISILIIGAATIFPLFLEEAKDDFAILVLICSLTFIISAGLILWVVLSIKYVFKEDHLYVKGGPFRSRIRYEMITSIGPTKDIFTGYRLSTSRDGLEIFYKTAAFGSVKVSPKEKEKFISEIKKRNPHVTINL